MSEIRSKVSNLSQDTHAHTERETKINLVLTLTTRRKKINLDTVRFGKKNEKIKSNRQIMFEKNCMENRNG